MRIHLHIDRILLDGLPAGATDRDAVREAVHTELARLFTRGDGGSNFLARPSSSMVERLTGDAIRLAPTPRADQVGRQIARAVHGAIAP